MEQVSLSVLLYSTLMMITEAAETCRWLIIYVKSYFTNLYLLVDYISVNIPLTHGKGPY
jgi:hypothetical protein